ncbi:lipid-binding SYLF domain-containing protein [Mucilaginibacter sp. AW1-3]
MKTLRFFKLTALVLLATGLFFTSAQAQLKEENKINDATIVLREFGKMKESIPHQLLENTHGIIIIPKLINAGFVVGGKRGKGIAMVKDANGKWSDPVFVTLTGGSFGLQVGVQSVDLVLVFKHDETLANIGKGSFTLGGDISAAAGPVGRSSTANTDYKFQAEVYSYSRSRGLFAGITLNGASLSVDQTSNTNFYGKNSGSAAIFAEVKNTSTPVKNLKVTLESL